MKSYNLFQKFFGGCFVAQTSKGLVPTMGLNFFLHQNATGNAVTRHLPLMRRPSKVVNKSRYMR